MKKLLILLFTLVTSAAFCDNITFHADMMKGNTKNKNKPTTLIGHAYIKTDTMEISADQISMSGDDFRFITAEGNISGKNSESKMDFTCEKMRYDRQTKIVRLEDSVTLKDLENEIEAKAQIIDYNQNTEISILQIDVNLKQKDNTCTSAYAIYRKNTKMLEMSGNPKIVQGTDTFRAQEITLNLDTQEITLDGRVSGTVTESEKKNQNEEPQAQNAAAPETPAESNPPEGEIPAEPEQPEEKEIKSDE